MLLEMPPPEGSCTAPVNDVWRKELLAEVSCGASRVVVVSFTALDAEEGEEGDSTTVLVMMIGEPSDGVTVTITTVLLAGRGLLLVDVMVLLVKPLDREGGRV
jgi:hypothetical protein